MRIIPMQDRADPSMELEANNEKAARSKIAGRLNWLLEKWRGRHTRRCHQKYHRNKLNYYYWNYSTGLIWSYDTKRCYIKNCDRERTIGSWRRETRERSSYRHQEQRDKKR